MSSEEVKNQSTVAETNPSFLDKLSLRGKEALNARAKNVYVAIRTEAQQRVSAAYAEVLSVETEIANHEDVGVKNAQDLKPDMKEAPAVWVARALELQKKLYYARLAYSLASNWFNAQFPAKDEVSLPEVKVIQGI